MAGFGTYPALLPLLQHEWALTGARAGMIAGAYFGGYMLAVPLLSGLTDRFDARRVYAGACVLAAAALLGFAAWARDFASAVLFQALAGAGLAGTYMPGLKALADRLPGPRQPRYVSFYTATFGVGTSLSLLASGALATHVSWPSVFAIAAIGPILAGALVLRMLAPAATAPRAAAPGAGARAARRDPALVAYLLGYGVHCWELFGLRAWMVAFLAFSFGAASALTEATSTAAAISLLGIPASILGNEVAMRTGRRRAILASMAASGILAWAVGLAGLAAPSLVTGVMALYVIAVMADSAALTAGVLAVAPLAQRGATLAVYSLTGFGAGFIAPLVFGLVLDATGGATSRAAWMIAFGSLGAGCLGAALASGVAMLARKENEG